MRFSSYLHPLPLLDHALAEGKHIDNLLGNVESAAGLCLVVFRLFHQPGGVLAQIRRDRRAIGGQTEQADLLTAPGGNGAGSLEDVRAAFGG